MPQNLRELVNLFLRPLAQIFTLISILAVLVFFWGLAKFIFQAGDSKSHESGKELMKWGIITLFVMISLMGILSFLSGELGFGPVGIPLLPTR